jgi:MOSC domain-containing protein YiiM
MGRIKAICISERRGTQKKPLQEAIFKENFGIEGDAHAGNWHRQVSLISKEKIDAFEERGAKVSEGAFGENVIVEGIDFRMLPVGTKLEAKGVVLEMTQIGKECHSHCEIFHQVGDCIMPREGVFAKVLKGGILKVGDEMKVVGND